MAGLADRADWVSVEMAPFDGAFKDRPQDREDLADGRVADAGCGHGGPHVADHLGAERLQAGIAEARDDVDVQRGRLALPGVAGEVRGGVPCPPEL